jgi:CheY-like chemotaxis protein
MDLNGTIYYDNHPEDGAQVRGIPVVCIGIGSKERSSMQSAIIFADSRMPQSPPFVMPSGTEAVNVLTGKRVIIVEDEGITQMQLRRVLTMAGLKVVGFALTGEEGVTVALQERPDIVLMDITMPGNINGIEALRRIRTEYSVCVVMLTAYTEYQTEAEAAGSCGYIIKPIDSTTLIPQLAQAFTRWQRG